MAPAETYAIEGGSSGKSRLDVLAAGMAPSTLQLLERVGVPAGGTCLDVGCGGGHVTVELARLTGPSGLAVGVDFDADIVALAAEAAAQLDVVNAQFRHGDATRLSVTVGDIEFDVAYSRFLLSHLAAPGDVVREMAGLVRPGGVVVVEDIDYRGTLCEPPNEAFQRYADLYRAIVRHRGADAEIGPRLPGFLDDAGLVDVDVNSIQLVGRDPRVIRQGDSRPDAGPHRTCAARRRARLGRRTRRLASRAAGGRRRPVDAVLLTALLPNVGTPAAMTRSSFGGD